MPCPVPLATLALLAGTLIADASADAAEGASRKTITVCSRYGNGCYTGPLRQGRWGLEVQLKSGRWLDCARDCHMAVREDSLDFWETQREVGGN